MTEAPLWKTFLGGGDPAAWELVAGPWPATISGTRLRVRTANLLSLRDPDPRLVAEILGGREDVLVLTECTPAWDARLREGLEARLPFSERVPREDSFEITVYARFPIPAEGRGWLP